MTNYDAKYKQNEVSKDEIDQTRTPKNLTSRNIPESHVVMSYTPLVRPGSAANIELHVVAEN